MQPGCPPVGARKVLWNVVSFIWHTDCFHLCPIQQWVAGHCAGQVGMFLTFPLGGISLLTNTREDTKDHEQSSPSLSITYENKKGICSYASEARRRWGSPIVMPLGISWGQKGLAFCYIAVLACTVSKKHLRDWFQSAYQMIPQKLTLSCIFRVTLLFFGIMIHAAFRYL